MAYISVALEVDATAIRDEQIAYLTDNIPGLELQAGHVLYWLIEADSLQHAENRQLLTEQTELLFQVIGERLFRVLVREPTQATGVSTWVAADTAGHTIPAGTEITLARPDGEREGFLTRNEVTIPALASSTAVGEVQLIAVNPGLQGTGLQADAQPEDTFDWLQSITVIAPTVGGDDGETEAEYRDRLADRLQLMADTLVLARDYELEARTASPEIVRALALDEYNPAVGPVGSNPGHITVAVVDEAGLDPGAGVRTAGEARQQELSVANLTVHWIAATYNDIDVVFAAKCDADQNPADVEARAEQAVLDFLSPARWGLPLRGDQALWLSTPIVRFQDVSAVLNDVDGLSHWTSLTINGGTADITMTGAAPLPSATLSSAAGTVTAP